MDGYLKKLQTKEQSITHDNNSTLFWFTLVIIEPFEFVLCIVVG